MLPRNSRPRGLRRGGLFFHLLRQGAPAEIVIPGAQGAGEHVRGHDQKSHDLRRSGHHHEGQHQAHQGVEGVAAEELHLFEADEFDVAHHQKGQEIDHYQDILVLLRGPFADLVVKGDGRGNNHGCRGDGEPVEVAGVHGAGLHIEAGQPERAADYEEKRGHPAELLEGFQGPEIDQDRGGHPEGHQVRQGIVLHPEAGSAVGHAGDAAVQAVQHQGDENGPGRG